MRHKTICFLSALLIGVLSLTSCDKESDFTPDPFGGGNIKFKLTIASASGAQTYAAGTRTAYPSDGADFSTTFAEGDEVGIFAVKRASGASASLQATGNYIHNVKLTYSTADGGKWAASQTVNYPNDGDVLDFYAYYPYSALATDPTNVAFNVLTDQSTAVNYGKSDLLLAAPATGVVKEAVVNLTFSHKLSLIQVEVNPASVTAGKPLALTVKGCAVSTGFNLAAQTIATASGGAQDIKMQRVEAAGTTTAYTYRALVPAQTIAAGTSACLIEYDGKNYTSPPLAADLALASGKAERFTIAITAIPDGMIEVIVFTYDGTDPEKGYYSRLCAMTPDGSRVKVLYNGNDAAGDLRSLSRGVLSPDGTKIAAAGDYRLYVYDLITKSVFKPNIDKRADELCWTPDGQWINFTYDYMYKIRPDGSDLTLLTSSGDYQIGNQNYTPDGLKIMVNDWGGGSIYAVTPDDSQVTTVIAKEQNAVWYEKVWPLNNSKIIFFKILYSTYSYSLCIANIDGTGQTMLEDLGNKYGHDYLTANRAGNLIAYLRISGGTDRAMVVKQFDGTTIGNTIYSTAAKIGRYKFGFVRKDIFNAAPDIVVQ